MPNSRAQLMFAVAGVALGFVACGGGATSSASDASAGATAKQEPTAGRDAGGGATSLTGGAGALPASGGGSASASSGGSAAANSGGSASASTAGQGPTLTCRDSTGNWVPEAKACSSDADCLAVPTYSCCGDGIIVGLSKSAPEYKACLTTTRPQNCPALGCASYPSTEDNVSTLQIANLPSVVARCYDLESGRKGCMTTLSGSCVDHTTRCVAGDTCRDACDQACMCEQGFMVCTPPSNGQHCLTPQTSCLYQKADKTRLGCTCGADGAWACL